MTCRCLNNAILCRLAVYYAFLAPTDTPISAKKWQGNSANELDLHIPTTYFTVDVSKRMVGREMRPLDM